MNTLSSEELYVRTCPDCGDEFECLKDAPAEEVCPDCYESFDGLTFEELFRD
jgi:NMD protein affecting ribosome stability and mRNA decay